MDFLKKFNTEAQYDLAKDDFEWATVSLLKDVDEVRYMTMQDKYKREYLTFTALEDGTFTLTVPSRIDSTYMTSISYSLNNGETWADTTIDNTAQTITTPTINAGDKVLWKGVGREMSTSSYQSKFSSTGNFNVSGNIMSLLYGDEFANQATFQSGSTYNFANLFYNAIKLITTSNLVLPATTLTSYCYIDMFLGCTSLTTAPVLPATTLAGSCYSNMFSACTGLTSVPSNYLPATILANNCYQQMFYGCTSLTTAPVLPATTLANNCYYGMFQGCTSLTTAPSILPATTLAHDCYHNMFYGCTALTTAPSILPATTLAQYCYSSMFQDCTSLTTAPVLPATTLANFCYSYMFYGCTSLTTAPVLPATTLVYKCYQYMFRDCSSLNYIKAMFTTTPSMTYTDIWVGGVAKAGTFVKNSAATWTTTGASGVPSGWTVQTASE